jgi:hypothetical protein
MICGCWLRVSEICASTFVLPVVVSRRFGALIAAPFARHRIAQTFVIEVVLIVNVWCSGALFRDAARSAAGFLLVATANAAAAAVVVARKADASRICAPQILQSYRDKKNTHKHCSEVKTDADSISKIDSSTSVHSYL